MAEEKHVHMKILGCANIEIVHNLWVLAVFVGKKILPKRHIVIVKIGLKGNEVDRYRECFPYAGGLNWMDLFLLERTT